MFDDIASTAVRSALSGLAMRQRVSADNIANIETPNFSAGRVDFEGALRDAVGAGSSAPVAATTGKSVNAARQDGNNVNLDEETLAGFTTGLSYQLMLRALDNRYGLISTVLKGG